MSKFSIAWLVSAMIGAFFANPDTHTSSPTYADTSYRDLPLEALLPVLPEADTPITHPNNHQGDATHNPYVTPLQLGYPRNWKSQFLLDSATNGYNIYEKLGPVDVRRPSYISFEDYVAWREKESITNYFREQTLATNNENRKGLELNIDAEALSDIFGGGTISIRPTGFATLDFSVDHNRNENPALPQRQQATTFFNFDQQIQLGVIGQIGEKLRLNTNFDTQSTFQFEDELKLEHTGTEDQILQKIEAGNVSMQLGNSLIQGRQNLFGIKTKLRFGPVYVTNVASIERGKVDCLQISGGGAVETPFTKEASEYDMNRHFFLSHLFRSRYEDALANLPVIQSSLRVNRVEVWVEQQGSTRNNRNAVGFIDLGENDNPVGNGSGRVYNKALQQTGAAYTALPDNNSNNLFDLLSNNPAAREQNTAKSTVEGFPGLGMQNTADFQVLGNMRRLEPNEYTLNTQLGYISLNSPVPTDQVLFVAYNYSLNGQTHQVGEFSDDIPADGLNSNVLFLKMLKASVLRVSPYPAWDLMMKNVYNIGYGLDRNGFFFDIRYESGTSAGRVNFLPSGAVANQPLIQVTGVDRVTNHTAPGPDNYFDFIEGVTVLSDRGMIIFPVLEPFGDYLAKKLNNNPDDVDRYVFNALYDDTQVGAVQNNPEKNRYTFEGYYRSSGGGTEIPLNTFNLQEGSVTVKIGGRPLTEGSEYSVNYSSGMVKILNASLLSSGQEISICFESSAIYQMQTKSLLGTRVEYSPSQNLKLGATLLNLREQPFNFKTVLGDEPVNNTLWGLDASFTKESAFLTKAIDRLPLISTKEKSMIQAAGEFAQFVPGAPAAVKNKEDRGVVYLDDFEAASSPFSQQSWQRWSIASFPEGNSRMFNPELVYPGDPLANNFSRAKLAWYNIDPTFFNNVTLRNNIPEEDFFNNYTRQILPWEIFPKASRPLGNSIQNTFDLHYFPNRRGPYNFQTDATKLDPLTGEFVRPEESWAGIVREIDLNNDFEATNVEFIEFWMMDPFMDKPNSQGGEFYFNLGLINEDLLPDESLSRESGIPGAGDPTSTLTQTAWGNVAIGNPPVNAFSNRPEDREIQDIGLDGLTSEQEATYFQQITNNLQGTLSPDAYSRYLEDPSSDNFKPYRSPEFDAAKTPLLTRYENYNGQEGNSPVAADSVRYSVQGTNVPDNEDINNNGSLNFAEQYWEYRIRLHPDSLQPGMNFVVDKLVNDSVPVGNRLQEVTWYQFRIPLTAGRPVNGITNFKTISFMRMYMTRFQEEAIMRLTEFQLVATQWRKYAGELGEPGVIPNPLEPPYASFSLGAVGVEDNSQKLPFNYIEPPGVQRQAFNGNTIQGFLEDERALVLRSEGLKDGDARGIFKNVRQDMRQYEKLRMWVHAEAIEDGGAPSNFNERGDARVFLRLGLDNDNNYYEYELPLTPSDPARGQNVATNTWLVENEINFQLIWMALAKDDRNQSGTGLIYRHGYRNDEMPEGHMIYVKGTPKLSDVRNIMIGIRNPKDPSGEEVSLEVWVNEMRLTNFDTKTGWAANANASVKLADIGTVNGTLAYKSAGFGPLEQKLSNRTQEDLFRYDLAANIALDKLMPDKWGLQMPVYATYGEQRINPVFNPQEADVRTDQLIEALSPEARREKLKEIQDFRRNRSISFNNWRKIKTAPAPTAAAAGGKGAAGKSGESNGPKVYPWDITNFDFTYAYNEQFARNSTIERRFSTQHRGAINYRYTFPQVTVKPFGKIEKVKFLKEMSFSPLPTSFSVAVAGDRQFEERLMRPTSQFGGSTTPYYAKNFLITRNYNLTWNLTRGLQLTYSANNIARVDEVRGYWNTATQAERDSVGPLIDNFLHLGKDPSKGHDQLVNFGRTTNFQHNFSGGYQLPFSKIKPLDWISGNINYSGSFTWQQAPEINRGLGATISNSQNLQANGKVDLNGFYKKFKPLKKVLESQNKQTQQPARPGAPAPGKPPVPTPKENPAEAKKDSVEKPDPLRVLKLVGKEVLRIALSVRTVDLTYSQTASTILPGYLPKTDNFGIDWGYTDPATGTRSPLLPPTTGFILGSQRDIRQQAGQNGWITRDTMLSNLYMHNISTNLTGRTSVELFRGFRIDLSANRSLTSNQSEFFRFDAAEDTFRGFDPLSNGNFTMSYIFANSGFEWGDPEKSEVFTRFSDIRQEISSRYAEKNPETAGGGLDLVTGGYRNGYLGTNQEVLVTSFLAAYGAMGVNGTELSAFPKIPLPNWSINYNGLSSLPFLKKYFTSVTLKHTYRGTYSVGSFANNLNAYDLNYDGIADNFDLIEVDPLTGQEIRNYYAVDVIQAVQISEQFAPLIGINVNFKNGITSQIDYKRGRQMTFNVGNLQLTESRSEDIAVMIGWRKDKLNWNFRFAGRDISMKNSLNAQLRATVRDVRDINFTLSPDGIEQAQAPITTRGALNMIINPSVDYVVNTRVSVKVFWEQNMNRPHVFNAYNTAFMSGGVQIRFTLAN